MSRRCRWCSSKGDDNKPGGVTAAFRCGCINVCGGDDVKGTKTDFICNLPLFLINTFLSLHERILVIHPQCPKARH